MDLTLQCYQCALRLPTEERYGLATQIRRAAASIPANIAEGHARTHRGDYLKFLSIARGSVAELATHLELAERLEYLTVTELAPLRDSCDAVSSMLTRLKQRLND